MSLGRIAYCDYPGCRAFTTDVEEHSSLVSTPHWITTHDPDPAGDGSVSNTALHYCTPEHMGHDIAMRKQYRQEQDDYWTNYLAEMVHDERLDRSEA